MFRAQGVVVARQHLAQLHHGILGALALTVGDSKENPRPERRGMVGAELSLAGGGGGPQIGNPSSAHAVPRFASPAAASASPGQSIPSEIYRPRRSAGW